MEYCKNKRCYKNKNRNTFNQITEYNLMAAKKKFGGRQEGAGRPKGPAAERFIRHALRKAGHSGEGLWDKAVELAMNDNVPMIKTLLDKMAPNLKAVESAVSVSGDPDLKAMLDAAEGTGLTGRG